MALESPLEACSVYLIQYEPYLKDPVGFPKVMVGIFLSALLCCCCSAWKLFSTLFRRTNHMKALFSLASLWTCWKPASIPSAGWVGTGVQGHFSSLKPRWGRVQRPTHHCHSFIYLRWITDYTGTGSWSPFSLLFFLWPLTHLGSVLFCLASAVLSIGYPKTLPQLQFGHNCNHWSGRQTARRGLDKIIPPPKASYQHLPGWENGLCVCVQQVQFCLTYVFADLYA